MKVAIIGAGIAGLGAARTLVQAGVEVVVFEKSRGFGGRATTRRLGDYVFDQGATSIAPRGKTLERVMLTELDTSDLIPIERPIYVHKDYRVSKGDDHKNKTPRFNYRYGINTLGKLLGQGVETRLETWVERIEFAADGGYAIQGEFFDRLILTCPLPQAHELLKGTQEERNFGNSSYRKCLSIMLGFREPLDQPWHAVIDVDQAVPLTWLSIESVKVPGSRAPEGCSAIVAQMSARYSSLAYEFEEQRILDETLIDVQRLLGGRFSSPEVFGVMRWRFSQPELTISFDSVNRPGATCLVAGDGLVGGRLELAYDCGVRAAQCLLEKP
ncbi:MAG: FAD-dependent oxidoreductase [Fimbriimonadaceae bacterium]|jgi:hypothetical protein|nr:FAD-dependent oxidoreductase [Fimbriimonadaceae bacterium]